MKKNILKHNKRSKQSGFTLIELIVVIGIFTVITAVAFVNQGQLNSSVLLTNTAYETALAVREAQVYGLGVRKNEINSSNEYDGEYGVYFNMENPRQIIVYSNNPIDPLGSLYNPGLDTDAVNLNEARFVYEFSNQRGNKILALCLGDLEVAGADGTSDKVCSVDSSFSRDEMHITFRRPEPRANFFSQGADVTGSSFGPAYIVVSTADEKNCKVIIVHKTGQIQVEGADKGHCKIYED